MSSAVNTTRFCHRNAVLCWHGLRLPVGFGSCFSRSLDRFRSYHTATDGDDASGFDFVTKIVNISTEYRNSADLDSALGVLSSSVNESIILSVLRRCQSDWKSAFAFFNWATRHTAFPHGSGPYNEMLDILGRAKKVKLMTELFNSITEDHHSVVIDENTFAILYRRYASAHQVQEAIDLFYKRKDYGFEVNLAGFQALLVSLCHYKHVEEAESLFLEKKGEFPPAIKSWNIILNGWCILGSLHDAKRIWNDISSSDCKPDVFTYGAFINSLTKAGKIGSALKLFRSMGKKGVYPDIVIHNCIIDALCFKKKIPQALEIFSEMKSSSCPPNVVTYNSLVKHLCRINRMEKVYEILNEMEEKGCEPNTITYSYILKTLNKPDDAADLVHRIERGCCRMDSDSYNLLLKLYIRWKHWEGAYNVWNDMEKNGLGPDQRSFTIMIHGLYENSQFDRAMEYCTLMNSRELIPEKKTRRLIEGIRLEKQKTDALSHPVESRDMQYLKRELPIN